MLALITQLNCFIYETLFNSQFNHATLSVITNGNKSLITLEEGYVLKSIILKMQILLLNYTETQPLMMHQ